MKKVIAIILIVSMFLMVGCSTLTGPKVGTKTTTFDKEGKTQTIVEDKALDDKYSNYSDSSARIIESVSNAKSKAIEKIAEIYKPTAKDSEIVSLAKSAIAGAQITTIEIGTRLDLVLAQIKYGKDGYDVADTIAGGFVQMVVTAVPWLAAGSMIKRGYDAAGDKTNITMGNENYVSLKQEKTNVNSYITAGNTGNESNVSVPFSPNVTGSSPSTAETTITNPTPVTE